MSEESSEFDHNLKKDWNEKRARDFLECLGNGKTMVEIESEEDGY